MTNQKVEWIDVKKFIKRRWTSFVVLFSIILVAAVILAFTLPPIYRAETTILIEEQQIPENYVQSTITTYAEERLNTIKQQVLSADRLKDIIDQFGLYPEIRKKYGLGEAVREMQESIELETMSASFVNPITGRSMAATIAFTLYYQGKEPEIVKEVTNVLGKLFLEEDVKIREKITDATTGFLIAELENLKQQIQVHEKEISDFKQKHFGELPEHDSVNLASVGRLERELERISMQIRNLQERKINLEGQLSTVDPLLPIKIDGKSVARNPAEQLKYLRLKLISMQSVLSDKHPDIKNIKSEIKKLESTVNVPVDRRENVKQLENLSVKLAGLRGRYGEKHPDVVKTKKEIDRLEKSNSENAPITSATAKSESPDNPTYINLKTQIATVETTIRNLESDKQDVQADLAKYRRRIETAPMVEKEYLELTRNYDLTNRKYDEIMNKLMNAKVAKGMEEGKHGQRFEIKSHAYLPGKPYKPNRIAIILLGFVLASGFGFGVAAIQEFFDHSIKNEQELAYIAQVPVLSVIDKVQTRQEKLHAAARRFVWVIAAFSLVVVGAKMINDYFIPLNELWEIIQENAKKM